MSHIYDLFDHIMETIFKKLPRHDRLKCKEVCQQWYNYLMELPAFLHDRHIYLHNRCRVDDPLLIFSAAKGCYENLTVKCVKETDDFGPLARVLGNNGLKNVYFTFTKTTTIHQMLFEFPFIESIHFVTNCFLQLYNISSELILFEKLKNAKVNILQIDSKNLKKFFDMEVPALQKLIPKEATIKVVVSTLKLDEWTSDIEKAISVSNVHFELNNVEISSDCTSKRLSEFTKGNFMFNELNIRKPQLFMKNDIDVLLGQMENLKEFSVTIETFSDIHNLTPASIQKITKLSIDGYFPCPGEHETFHLPSLVDIEVGKIDCEECLNAFFNSFLPKLKKLQIIDPPFLRNWENLESLKVYIRTLENAGIFQNALPSLRSLTIAPFRTEFFEVSVKSIEDIGKLCQQLEIFNIICYDKELCIYPSLDFLKGILTTGFEKLKTFHVTRNDYELDFFKKSGVVEKIYEPRYYYH